MITILLMALAVFDLALVVAMARLQRRQTANQEVIRELTEERTILLDLRNQIRSELQSTQAQVRAMKDQVQVLATEAEQEVKAGVAEITKEVDTIIANVSQKLDAPMMALNEKQHFIARLTKDARDERELLNRLVTRAENAAKLLRAGASWKDVVEELEAKKYQDIRAMVSKGVPTSRIVKELNVTEQEIKLVCGAR